MSNINNTKRNLFLHPIFDGLENAASRKTNYVSFFRNIFGLKIGRLLQIVIRCKKIGRSKNIDITQNLV